ncbi:MAG: hypothetical protein AAF696_13300 [Bacteroidota bacterium]
MTDLQNANLNLVDLIFFCLDHSIEVLTESRVSFVPFGISETGGLRKLESLDFDDMDMPFVFRKQDLLPSEKQPDFFAYASLGRLVLGTKDYHAVKIEAFDKAESIGHTIVQLYRPRRFFIPFKLLGDPVYLGSIENLLVS